MRRVGRLENGSTFAESVREARVQIAGHFRIRHEEHDPAIGRMDTRDVLPDLQCR